MSNSIYSSLPVTCHTDFVSNGTTFVAIKGSNFNGIDFIPLALDKGATKIVIQDNIELPINTLNKIQSMSVELSRVYDCRKALSELSAAAWNYPAKKVNIIGVTGTKGKTTSVFLLNHILVNAGYKTAIISGVKNSICGKNYQSNLTTPHPDYIHAFLNQCIQEKVQFVILESSAQAFSLNRLSDIQFSGVVFTNFDLEHSEFYSDMDEYFEAKCRIFNQVKKNCPIILNNDNNWLEKKLKDSKFLSFSFTKNANYMVQIEQNSVSGIKIRIENNKKSYSFEAPNLFGTFNAYNIAGVVSLALELDINIFKIQKALTTFLYVPGRMERYELSNGSLAIIDYAHNPSSFTQVLSALRSLTKKLIVVFGAGGDRAKDKRSMMGNIAASLADHVIITNDNPRSENPIDIVEQIISGIDLKDKNKIICELDRAKAINKAYSLSNKGDIIAILGKGIDEYQIVGDKKSYFSDKKTILSCAN